MGHGFDRLRADDLLVRPAVMTGPAASRLLLLPGLDGTGGLFAPLLHAWPHQPAPLVIGYPRDRFLNYRQCVDHVIAQLPVDGDFMIVAESFSGPVGIALAGRLPDRVKALVLCATFATAPRRGLLNALISFLAPLILRFPAPRIVVREVLLNGHRDDALLAHVCENKSLVSPDVMARRLREVLSCDAREELARVRCPVLYLQASRDRLVTPAAAREIAQINPGAKIAIIDAPHFVLQANPGAVIREIMAIADVGSRRNQPPMA